MLREVVTFSFDVHAPIACLPDEVAKLAYERKNSHGKCKGDYAPVGRLSPHSIGDK